MADRVHENRVRRMAARQGLVLKKSRRRDPWALDFGRYWLIEPTTNVVATYLKGDQWGLTLEQLEYWLTTGNKDKRAWSPLVEKVWGRPCDRFDEFLSELSPGVLTHIEAEHEKADDAAPHRSRP